MEDSPSATRNWPYFSLVEIGGGVEIQDSTETIQNARFDGRARSYSLDTPNARITRAVVMVHGTGRNADHYFLTTMSAAFLAGALDDTVVIAPHMIDATDRAEPNEVVWQSSWRTGGPARDNPGLTSFDFVDEILRKLARKSTFPNLRQIVVTGHSAGGQFTNRYAMANKVHDTLGAKHKIVIVPECGHNDRCMFTTGIVFPYVFPGAAETK